MKTKTIEQYRQDYKHYQDHAARFGVDAQEFNSMVRTQLRNPKPTPVDWTVQGMYMAQRISGGRCCPKAECIPCVCEVSYKCPDHGVRCKGSHD